MKQSNIKRYAVFTETEFVPTHELSLSNKIVEREDVLTVLKIVQNWVNSIYPNTFVVYCKGNDTTICNITMCLSSNAENQTIEFKHMGLVALFGPSNIKFRIGTHNTTYTSKPV